MEYILGNNGHLVSCIIPTHKGQDLTRLIKSIKNSTYKQVEIIVVDEGLERSKQRNIGIDRAKGKYLMFLDSDMAVSKDLISECVYLIQNCSGIYLPEKIMTKGFFAKVRDFERQFYTATPVDCVRFVKAYRCPRFDENMSGPEDSDWDRRVGGKRLVSKSVVYHYDNVSLKRYIQKKMYYTKSMREFHKKNPKDKILDLRYRCWGVFVDNGKWKEFIKHPILAMGVIFILFLRGVIYLTK